MTSTAEGYDFAPKHTGHGHTPEFGDTAMSYERAGERTMSLPPLGGDAAASTKPPTTSVFTPIAPVIGQSSLDDDAVIHVHHRKGHRAAWILSVLFILLMVIAGAFYAAHVYFQDKVAPGVVFGNTSVMGKNAHELTALVDGAVSHSTITISDGQGNTTKASLHDLGVTVDKKATIRNLLGAKRGNLVGQLNPFVKTTVPLAATTDKLSANAYLTNAFVKQSDRAVPSSIRYDQNAKKFVVVEGKGGRIPVSTPVNAAVDRAINHPGTPASVTVSYRNVAMPISVINANKAADDANAHLSDAITITAGDPAVAGQSESFTIPVDRVAAWITPSGDPDKGSIALRYDNQAIADYVNTQIPGQMNRKMVTQEDVVDGSGKLLLTRVHGVDGITLKNVPALSNQIYQALSSGQPVTVKADADIVAHDVKQVVSRYRIVIDRSKQIATVYEGDNIVKTFLVCTGKPGHNETTLGTYAIYLKYKTQDMRGDNDDGTKYLSKGVRWVGYFNGGEGFHTALWNYPGIARGDAANNGSHGCVNMYEQDAQWIYDNCPEGTVVTVVGAQPNGPVR